MKNTNLLEELKDIVLKRRIEDGVLLTDVPRLSFFTCSQPTEYLAIVYEPSLCVVINGSKEVVLDKPYTYDTQNYLISSTHMPSTVKVLEGTKQNPYIGLKLTFSMDDIYEVLKATNQINRKKSPKLGICFGQVQESLLEPLTRLSRLCEEPQKI